MIKNSRILLVLFLLLNTTAGYVNASEKQQTKDNLYQKSIKKSELPGHPNNDFLKTVVSIQTLQKQPRTLAHWRHEYKLDSHGERQLVTSHYYRGDTVTIYTHHKKKK